MSRQRTGQGASVGGASDPAVGARAAATPGAGAARGSALRPAIWALHMALPLAGLWLLLAQPELDGRWQHNPSHFALFVGIGGVNGWLGWRMSRAGDERRDARLGLVGLAFLSAAGFLFMHGLATPHVLIPGSNTGFMVAAPVGLALASALAAASSLEFSERSAARVIRWLSPGRAALLGLLVVWAAWSVLQIPPLDVGVGRDETVGLLAAMAVAAIPLYVLAAGRYLLLYRRRPAVLLLSLATAWVLLAESMVAVATSQNWHASWWLWHVLAVLAFGFVAYSAQVQERREGSAAGLFDAVALRQTLRDVEAEYRAALDGLVDSLRAAQDAPTDVLAARHSARFGLTEAQGRVLAQAGTALADERTQRERLQAMVAAGHETRVIVDEDALLERVLAAAAAGFPGTRLEVRRVTDGQLEADPDGTLEAGLEAGGWRTPAEPRPGVLALPLTVKGQPAGAVLATRPAGFGDLERWALESLASQLAVALENARLYAQLEGLFRSYISPDVATALLADPAQAGLGGAVAEVTVLFADLRGFTPYAERTSPDEVVAMLNRYFGAAVPAVLAEGGTVVQFVGDALMAVFNAPARQPDHPLRAARAALALQAAAEEIAAERKDWPRFRVGVNTGPALVGNIGGEQVRNYTAIGDTTNLAARLESLADAGQVVIGPATRAALGDAAVVEPLGALEVKGKASPVEAFALTALREETAWHDR